MDRIKLFDGCGGAKDLVLVVPELFGVEKLENPAYQPSGDILRH